MNAYRPLRVAKKFVRAANGPHQVPTLPKLRYVAYTTTQGPQA